MITGPNSLPNLNVGPREVSPAVVSLMGGEAIGPAYIEPTPVAAIEATDVTAGGAIGNSQDATGWRI